MMTTDQRAELDAVMGRATAEPWAWDAGMIPPDGPGGYADIYILDEDREPIILAEFNDNIPQGRDNARAIVALHNAYPLLTATIDAQAAEIARLREALRDIINVRVEGWENIWAGASKCSSIARAALTSPGAA